MFLFDALICIISHICFYEQDVSPSWVCAFKTEKELTSCAERIQAPILIVGPRKCVSCDSALLELKTNRNPVIKTVRAYVKHMLCDLTHVH